MGIIMKNLDQLEKALQNPAIDPWCKKMEATIGINRKWVALAIIVASFLGLLIGYASQLICNVIGFIYPAYESIKAIETANSKDDTKWLTYWVVYSAFILIEFFSDYLLHWIPFYFFLKVGLLIWCMHPSYNGTTFIYNTVIRPLFLRNEKRVDDLLIKARNKGKAVYSKVADEAKDTLAEAREEVLQSDAVKGAAASAMQAAAETYTSSKQD